VCVRAYVCMCACVRTHAHTYTHAQVSAGGCMGVYFTRSGTVCLRVSVSVSSIHAHLQLCVRVCVTM